MTMWSLVLFLHISNLYHPEKMFIQKRTYMRHGVSAESTPWREDWRERTDRRIEDFRRTQTGNNKTKGNKGQNEN